MPASGKPCGPLVAIAAYGAQNEYMDAQPPEAWDVRKKLLTGRYHRVYMRVPTTTKTIQDRYDHKVEPYCDLFNMVDLVIENPSCACIGTLIKSVEVEVGGQRFDKVSHVEQFKTNAALFGRTIRQIGNKTFVPLAMAPLHAHNLMQPKPQYHDVVIRVTLVQDANYEIWADSYFLDTPERLRLRKEEHEFNTTQTQYIGEETFRSGTDIKLYFNHPMYCIYFWGFDKTKVKNIRILLEGAPLYDGPIEQLERIKLDRGLDVDPVIYFFSRSRYDEPMEGDVNLSRIDDAVLQIETTQEGDIPLHVTGHNLQPIRFVYGMYGSRYSK